MTVSPVGLGPLPHSLSGSACQLPWSRAFSHRARPGGGTGGLLTSSRRLRNRRSPAPQRGGGVEEARYRGGLPTRNGASRAPRHVPLGVSFPPPLQVPSILAGTTEGARRRAWRALRRPSVPGGGQSAALPGGPSRLDGRASCSPPTLGGLPQPAPGTPSPRTHGTAPAAGGGGVETGGVKFLPCSPRPSLSGRAHTHTRTETPLPSQAAEEHF